MPAPLRILILEDDPSDVELIVAELRRAGFEPAWTRVTAKLEFLAALEGPEPEVILADFSLPQFGALDALEILNRRGLEVPVIIVSGTIGEEMAVSAMRHGASDYLLKDRLARLGLAVSGVLERQRNRAERRRAEQRFQSLIENSFDIITLLDAKGTILYESPSVQRVLGFEPTELIGRSLFEFVEETDGSPFPAIFQGRAHEAVPTEPVEFRFRHKDGTWRYLEAVGTNLLADPNVGAIVVNSWDVTKRRLLEEEFRQAQKMEAIGRLAGGVAHDFNNLLTTIIGYADLLLGELQPDSSPYEDASEVRKAADRASALTGQLLAFSRKQILQPKVLHVNSVLTNSIRMLQRLIGEDVELSVDFDPASGYIRIDPGQIEQIIINLAINARDAMPGGGRLVLRTRRIILNEASVGQRPKQRPGEYAMLRISDTGCGMDEQTLSRIFEPFFSTKGEKGTGLGLSTVYAIIEQCGGHIEVESKLGIGTTFRVYLPQANRESADDEVVAKLESPIENRETILVVEDELALRTLVSKVLTAAGYRVIAAGHGLEALQLTEHHSGPIHLLLTDVVMPQMSGRELAGRLLGTRPDLKVLYMSGYTDDAVVRHGVIKRDMILLQKPFAAGTLTRAVREVLDGRGVAGS